MTNRFKQSLSDKTVSASYRYIGAISNGVNPLCVKKIQKTLKTGKEAFLVLSQSNLFYLTGSDISGYWLLLTKKDVFFISPRILEFQIKNFLSSNVFVSDTAALALKNAVEKIGIKKILCDASEINLSLYDSLAKLVEIGADKGKTLSGIRQVKSKEEIKIIKENQRITNSAIICARNLLKTGITESFVRKKIVEFFLKNGAAPAFEPIVAFGKNTAYPHHISGASKLKKNDVILIDVGCRRNGYCSDLTKTFFLGKIPLQKRWVYNAVKTAQEKVMKTLHSGVECRAIDEVARGFIEKTGYGRNFIHGTGHGVGIDAHESPSVSRKSKDKLIEGMVITVEPGIYLPGNFGVRIEDIVLVRKKDCEIL